MKTILLLLVFLFSINVAKGQVATIYYKDTVINTRIRSFDYEGLETKAKLMKWEDVRKVVFESQQSVAMKLVKDLTNYTTVGFLNEGTEIAKQGGSAKIVSTPMKQNAIPIEKAFVDEVITFDQYYDNNILPYYKSAKASKGAMIAGIGMSIIGSVILANAKDDTSKTPGEVFVVIGGVAFLGGLIGDLVALDKLKKKKVLKSSIH